MKHKISKSQLRMAYTFYSLAERSGKIAATHFPHPFEGKYWKEGTAFYASQFRRQAEQMKIALDILEQRADRFNQRYHHSAAI